MDEEPLEDVTRRLRAEAEARLGEPVGENASRLMQVRPEELLRVLDAAGAPAEAESAA